MNDDKWNSNLLKEIAGEEWRDEPELVGAVGSAGDLLQDVRFDVRLAEELSEEQIEHVRSEMPGIRDALIDIWKSLERVAPSSICLGSLCVHEAPGRDGDESSWKGQPSRTTG